MSQEKAQSHRQLWLLSGAYSVYAVIVIIWVTLLVIPMDIGIRAIVHPAFYTMELGLYQPTVFGLIIFMTTLVIILTGWAYGIGLLWMARFLIRREQHFYCLMMSWVSCLFLPFGTLLGIISLIILFQRPVAELFDEKYHYPEL